MTVNKHSTREAQTQTSNSSGMIGVPEVILSIVVSDNKPGGVNSVCPTSVSK